MSVHIFRASTFSEPQQYLTDKPFRWDDAAFPRYFATKENGGSNEPLYPRTCRGVPPSCRPGVGVSRVLHSAWNVEECNWKEKKKEKKGCPGVHIWWSVMRTGTWGIRSINTSWTMWHAVTLLMHFPTLWHNLLCSCTALIVFHFTIINSYARGGDLELSFIHSPPFRGRPSRLEKRPR